MAKQPNVIPFQEGAPPDNLEVEEIENNEVLIGDKSLDDIVEITDEHDSNIAEEIDEQNQRFLTKCIIAYTALNRANSLANVYNAFCKK